MAAVASIHAVAGGLAQYLSMAYQAADVGVSCAFQSVGSSDFKKLDGKDTTCSIFVYRVTHNEYVRNLTPVMAQRAAPLALDVHLLFTMWADSSLKETTVIGWLMRELHQRPVLDGSILLASGSFSLNDQIQLIPTDMSLDDISKLWQALVPPLRLSAAYIARNVRIGFDPEPDHAPVVATRLALGTEVEVQ